MIQHEHFAIKQAIRGQENINCALLLPYLLGIQGPNGAVTKAAFPVQPPSSFKERHDGDKSASFDSK